MNTKTPLSSSYFINIILFVSAYFIYITYKTYLLDIAIAILMAMSLSKVEIFAYNKTKNKYLSSSVVTILFVIFLVFPILYFIVEISGVISNLSMETIHHTLDKAKNLLNFLPDFVKHQGEEWFNNNNLDSLYKNIILVTGKLTTSSLVFFKDTILIIIFFFFINLYSDELLLYVRKIMPLSDNDSNRLFDETTDVMSLVFYSVFLTALLEGILFGFIVWMYGFSPLFWMIMYAFASLIPVIGGALMWVPVSLYLYSKGEVYEAIGVASYSIVVISIIADTFVKTFIIDKLKEILKTSVELNSILIFFSIIAGLSSFGFWGVLIGPAVTTLFISVLKFYKKFG